MGSHYRRACCGLYDPRVGFNPFRRHRANRLDIVMVVVTLGVAAALVAWAIWG